MTTSYKIALIAAVTLCGMIVGYAFFSSRQTPPQSNDSVWVDDVSPPVGEALAAPADRPGPPSSGVGEPSLIFDPKEMADGQRGLAGPDPALNGAEVPSGTVGSDNSDADGLALEPRVRTFGVPAPVLMASSEPQSGTASEVVGKVARSGISEVAVEISTPPLTAASSAAMETPSSHPQPLRTYMIRTGDTFSSLAIRDYGAEKYWVDIAAANPHIDPRRLRPGQIIKMPDSSALEQHRGIHPTPEALSLPGPPVEGKIHIVRGGESLSTISRFYYRHAESWRLIYNANREVIGIDPGRLEVGTRLVIPKASEAAGNE